MEKKGLWMMSCVSLVRVCLFEAEIRNPTELGRIHHTSNKKKDVFELWHDIRHPNRVMSYTQHIKKWKSISLNHAMILPHPRHIPLIILICHTPNALQWYCHTPEIHVWYDTFHRKRVHVAVGCACCYGVCWVCMLLWGVHVAMGCAGCACCYGVCMLLWGSTKGILAIAKTC